MDGNLKILKIQRGRMYDEPKMKKIVNQQQQNRYWATIEIHPSTMYFGNISITILQSSSSKFLLWSPSKSHHHQKFFPPIEYINVFLAIKSSYSQQPMGIGRMKSIKFHFNIAFGLRRSTTSITHSHTHHTCTHTHQQSYTIHRITPDTHALLDFFVFTHTG